MCDFPGCGRAIYAKNLCKGHHLQQWRGRPLAPLHSKKRPNGTPPRIDYDEMQCPQPSLSGPCHVFHGRKDRYGYGRIDFNDRPVLVHRYIWELANGPIPDGKFIDHMCRNRACCNVAHLRCVTPKVNATENCIGNGWQVMAAKTHCPRGHPYSEKTEARRGLKQ